MKGNQYTVTIYKHMKPHISYPEIKKPFLYTFMMAAMMFIVSATFAQSNQWPKDIPLKNGGKITIYQPQPESLQGDKLAARAAVSVRKSADDEPVFGAIWMDALLDIDKDKRTATLESVTITNAKFSDSITNTKLIQINQLIQNEVPKWNMQMSLDALLTSIQQEQQINDANLKNDPPKIYYRTTPSTLVSIEGQPQLQKDNDLNIDRVINTPFLIVKNPDDNRYYLYANDFWYSASSATGNYSYIKNLPSRIQQINTSVQQNQDKNNGIDADDKPKTPTQILVSTEPAELIQTEGEANYSVVQGTTLLYANNSLDEIFKDVNTQKTYTLLSGRWYSADNLNGPWAYVPSDKLPADFAKIPRGSEKDGVLASVAGTDEAEDAIIDAQIPQTAKVDKKTATCTVTYDGAPQFSPIDNTNLQVAENSNITVLRAANGMYYAMQDGVWFISENATGPWSVANERPSDVDKIPPSSTAYNTKYVYIYDNTPDYVYMGYTPGYLGCYVYGPTVVYGTGWYYRPWYRVHYYPRPVTWGFGFSYNPWIGWGMGFNMMFNFGWYRPGYYYRTAGWFGPSRYRPPYRPWGWNGGFYGRGGRTVAISRPNVTINRPVNITINNNININRGGRINNNINIYNRRQGIATTNINRGRLNNSVTGRNNAVRPSFATPNRGNNNVYTDRQGNVFRNDRGNWQQRNNSQWRATDNHPSRPELDKDRQQRDRGMQRDNNFQRNLPREARPTPRPYTPTPSQAPAPRPATPRPSTTSPQPRPVTPMPRQSASPAPRPAAPSAAPAPRPASPRPAATPAPRVERSGGRGRG